MAFGGKMRRRLLYALLSACMAFPKSALRINGIAAAACMQPREPGPFWREGCPCEDTAAGVGDDNRRKWSDASEAMTISVVSARCGAGSSPTRDQRSDRAEVARGHPR